MWGKILFMTVGLLLGGNSWGSPKARTTYMIGRQQTQVTTELHEGSSRLAERRQAELNRRVQKLRESGQLRLALNPPAEMAVRLQVDQQVIRIQTQFVGQAPTTQTGTYLVRVASAMKALNEYLIE